MRSTIILCVRFPLTTHLTSLLKGKLDPNTGEVVSVGRILQCNRCTLKGVISRVSLMKGRYDKSGRMYRERLFWWLGKGVGIIKKISWWTGNFRYMHDSIWMPHVFKSHIFQSRHKQFDSFSAISDNERL